MNPVRTLLALLVVTLAGMGTWVWKIKTDEAAMRRLVLEVRESKARALEVKDVGSSRVDLQACKLEYSIVSPK